jgi:hypothetical protein
VDKDKVEKVEEEAVEEETVAPTMSLEDELRAADGKKLAKLARYYGVPGDRNEIANSNKESIIAAILAL